MRTKDKHQQFLNNVCKYITDYPEVAPYVTEFISIGIEEALYETRKRAGDMEAALAMEIWGKKKDKTLIKEYVARWRGKSSLSWDWFLETKADNTLEK